MSSSFKKSYKLDGFICVSDVELCHLKNVAHSNVIINTIAKQFLFLKRDRKRENYECMEISHRVLVTYLYCYEIMTPKHTG
jgi:hypothetical protein